MFVLVSAAVLVVLLDVLIGGYVEHWAWTGYRDSDHKLRTLWDWLGVSALAVGARVDSSVAGNQGPTSPRLEDCGLSGAAVFVLLVLGGYLLQWRWTGFTGNSVYDWLQLFLVPCVLPVAFSVLGPRDSKASGDQRGSSAHAEIGGSRVAWGAHAVWAMAAAALLVVGTVAAQIVAVMDGLDWDSARLLDEKDTAGELPPEEQLEGFSLFWPSSLRQSFLCPADAEDGGLPARDGSSPGKRDWRSAPEATEVAL
jgi:hypothetical protein